MKDWNTNNIALLCMVLCSAFGAFAAEPLRGPEAWLELMGGNVRKDTNLSGTSAQIFSTCARIRCQFGHKLRCLANLCPVTID